MPLYSYRCPDCGADADVFKRIADIDRQEFCSHCSAQMFRAITAARVVADYAGYQCPITGDWIEGRRAHQENLAKHGCRVLETGEVEDARRFRANSDAALEKSIEETVEAEIHNMPTRKRETLIAELQSGVEANVIRQ